MEKQLNLFFGFLENEKKVSSNTLQSYKRDLKQFEKYLEENAFTDYTFDFKDVKGQQKAKKALENSEEAEATGMHADHFHLSFSAIRPPWHPPGP